MVIVTMLSGEYNLLSLISDMCIQSARDIKEVFCIDMDTWW